MSHNRKSSATVHHTADRCHTCGSADLSAGRSVPRQVTDIEAMPKAKTVTHVTHESSCNACGATVMPKNNYYVEGTNIGPNIAAFAVDQWQKCCTLSKIADDLYGLFGVKISKSGVILLVHAVNRKLAPAVADIKKDLQRSSVVKCDETPYGIVTATASRRGYVWCLLFDGGVVIILAHPSRGEAVLDLVLPGRANMRVTCDGYAAYNSFGTIQHCLSHLLRDTADLNILGAGYVALDRRLRQVYHDAKAVRIRSHDGPPIDTGSLVARAGALADGYEKLGCKQLAQKLRNALPNMFTFVNDPDMDPTNNETERMIRKVVLHRKNRYRLASQQGMEAFSNLLTCRLTWKKMGLNTREVLLEALCST